MINSLLNTAMKLIFSTRKIIFLIGFTSLESKTCVKSAKTFV